MIKIITGWSNPGGSTIAHIRLCNLFNENELECKLYGPHDWHLDKCKGGTFVDFNIMNDDIVLWHFMPYEAIKESKQFLPKKTFISCHETNLYPIKNEIYEHVDGVHFVSQFQQDWHTESVKEKSFVIPNICLKLKKNKKKVENIAGIIGSIDSHKQTGISIERALVEGWKEVHLYGLVTEPQYFETVIMPYVRDGKVILKGHVDNQQEIYDNINCVYHSSLRETFNFIKVECKQTGTEYKGLDSAESNAELWSDKKILEAWKKKFNE